MKFELANPAYYFIGGFKTTVSMNFAYGNSPTTVTGTPPDGLSIRQNDGFGDGLSATATTGGNFGYQSTAQGEWLNSKTGLEFNPWTASVTERVGVQGGPISVTMNVTEGYTARPDNWAIVGGGALVFAGGEILGWAASALGSIFGGLAWGF
jgi:hypothetical protein